MNWESAHVHPLDITPDGSKLLAVNTANNSLEIYSTSGGLTLTQNVPVGLDPVTVRARTNTEAWVVNVISDSISVVDIQNGIVTKTLKANDEPADIVFAGSSQNLALVSCAQARTLLVFSATSPTVPTATIPINGEQPRSLAVDKTGRYVYLAIFESGNGTTAVVGGASSGFENDLVQNPGGPYGGLGVPPNNGKVFNPPINPVLPAPPVVSLIVRRTLAGGVIRWLDDNLKDWSKFISGVSTLPWTPGTRVTGWDMPDRDVAIVDTTNNSVTYQSGLMNILMAIGVNPSTNEVTVVGTDSTNQIRYEPVLQSTFAHVNFARFTQGGANTISDLNPQLNYSVKSIPVAQRQNSIGDPRSMVWSADGTQGYVTGMGSNNVAIIGPKGQRLGLINVGQGPTGLVLASGLAYVLNKFDGSISTINLSSNTVTATTSLYFDPTPAAIKAGRPLLYNTQKTSGLGQASCASCHVDARWDRLAWDLGNPAGSMVTNPGVTDSGNRVTYHPMKGPFLTMTLADTMQAPLLHWRGDQPVLEDFEGAFQTLMGADNPASQTDINNLRNFLSTITLPPNPNRNLDNSYPTAVPIIGPNNSISGLGNANKGALEFEGNCRVCHPGHTNRSPLFIDTNGAFGAGIRNPPTWKNFYKRQGLWFLDPTASNSGFGFQQDGTFDSTQNNSRDNDLMAFMMSFNGGYPYEPSGLNSTNWSNFSHAAVGKQVTLGPANPTDTTGLLTQLEALGDAGSIGLVAKGGVVTGPTRRGWMYLGNGVWQSDHLSEVDSTTTLNSLIASGATITFTAVPNESAARIGIDMDGDGILDYDDAQPNVANVLPANLALAGTATAASVWDANHTAAQAIDGNTLGYFDQNTMLHTQGGTNDWWQEDLGANSQVSLIQLFNRWDCCSNRLANVSVFVSQVPFVSTDVNQTRAQLGVKEFFLPGTQGLLAQVPMQTPGRYVRVQLNNTTNPLQLAEVRVMGYAIASVVSPGTQTAVVGGAVNLPVTLQNATAGAVYSYSATNLPPGLSINSSTGAISGIISSPAASSYRTTLTASAPTGGSPSASFVWNVTAPPILFSVSVPGSLTLQAGQSGTAAVTISPIGGFAGTVALTASGLPAGVSARFSSQSVTSSTLTVSAPAASAPGTYSLAITGKSGSSIASTLLTVIINGVPPFTVSATPATVSLAPGGSNNTSIAVTAINGFTGGVTLSASNLPTGVTVSFAAAAGANATATFSAVSTAPSGTATVVLTATSGSYTQTIALPVTVGGISDFALASVTPASVSVQPGGSAVTSAIGVTALGGFTGSPVFTVGGLPAGVTSSSSGTTAAGYGLSFNASSSAAPGLYPLTVTATSGTLVHSTTVLLTVSLTSGVTAVDMSAAYNVYAIFNDGSPVANGGIDGSSYSYSSHFLSSSLTWGNLPFSIGPAGMPDAATSETIALPGATFGSLNLLAAATFGSRANQPFTVTYTDGTAVTSTQTLSDWGSPQNAVGEFIISAEAYRVTPNGGAGTGPWYVYGYSIPLNAAKTLQSVTLPNNTNVVVLAMTLSAIPPSAGSQAQTITFAPIANQTVGNSVTLGATASSGLLVTFSTILNGSCSISGNVVTFLAAGTCSVVASQSGNGIFAAAPAVGQVVPVGNAPQAQTITFASIVSQIAGGSVTLSAIASSGLPVTFSVTQNAVCSISGNVVSFLTPGSCSVFANQSGNSTFAVAPTITQVVTVGSAPAKAQTIAFAPITGQRVGTSLTVGASSSSGLPVSFSVLQNGACTISGNVVTFVATVSCSIVANQAGNSSFAPAAAVTQVVTVVAAPAQAQTITFAPIASQVVGTSLTLSASATSGLPVSLSVAQNGVCTISGNVVNFVSTGGCGITASQAGNSSFALAPSVTVSVSSVAGSYSPFTTGETLGALRNNYSDFVGFSMTTGSAPVAVSSLGRYVAPGDSGTHLLKLVTSDGTDLPGGSVSLSLAGATAGNFSYAALLAPVMLQPNTSYFLVSQETAGGDQWYDTAPVSTTSAAAVTAPVYSYGSGSYYQVPGLSGQSYVPLSFLYASAASSLSASISSPLAGAILSGKSVIVSVTNTGSVTSLQLKVDGVNQGSAVSSSPLTLDTTSLTNGSHTLTVVASAGTTGSAVSSGVTVTVNNGVAIAAPLITAETASTLRNNYSGFLGTAIQVGSTPLSVSALGRFFINGNSGAHTLKLVQSNGTDVPGSSVSVSMTVGTAGQFVYATLTTPVTLLANTSYYLVSQESAGGDTWYDLEPVTGTSAAQIIGATYADGRGNYTVVTVLPGYSYVPVNMLYQ